LYGGTTPPEGCLLLSVFGGVSIMVWGGKHPPKGGCKKITDVIMNEFSTRSSADADKPARRIYRSVKVTKHSTILYVR